MTGSCLEKNDSGIQICALAALNLAQQVGDHDVHLRERESRLLLTLAKWLQQENHHVSGEADDDKSALGRLLTWEKIYNSVNNPSVFGMVDIQSKDFSFTVSFIHLEWRILLPKYCLLLQRKIIFMGAFPIFYITIFTRIFFTLFWTKKLF